MFTFRVLRDVMFLAVSVPCALSGQGVGIVGTLDREVLSPAPGHRTIQRDVPAVTEIATYLSAVGDTTWLTLTGQGSITYQFPKGPMQGTASISLSGEHRFRLDADVGSTQYSFMGGAKTAVMVRNGVSSPLSEVEMETGFVAFPALRATLLDESSSSIIDHGLSTVGGKQLHRVAVERLIRGFSRSDIWAKSTSEPPIVVQDLYFDPNTHLLVKSSTHVGGRGWENRQVVSVISYGDYRHVGTSLFPYSFSQTVNGQLTWTVQLSELQVG